MIKKYIVGNKERGSEVIAELEKLGGVNELNFKGVVETTLYFIGPDDNIIRIESSDSVAGLIIKGCFEEIKFSAEPKLEEAEFKPFEKVLVRNEVDTVWTCDWFSHKKLDWYFCIGAGLVRECIPYEGNEDKVGKI